MYNADCRIAEPISAETGTDDLQRERSERLRPVQRCSLRRMSLRQEVAALGRVGVGTYVCRLQSDLDIGPGWRVHARIDGEKDWHYYVVLRAARTYHWNLTVERV